MKSYYVTESRGWRSAERQIRHIRRWLGRPDWENVERCEARVRLSAAKARRHDPDYAGAVSWHVGLVNIQRAVARLVDPSLRVWVARLPGPSFEDGDLDLFYTAHIRNALVNVYALLAVLGYRVMLKCNFMGYSAAQSSSYRGIVSAVLQMWNEYLEACEAAMDSAVWAHVQYVSRYTEEPPDLPHDSEFVRWGEEFMSHKMSFCRILNDTSKDLDSLALALPYIKEIDAQLRREKERDRQAKLHSVKGKDYA